MTKSNGILLVNLQKRSRLLIKLLIEYSDKGIRPSVRQLAINMYGDESFESCRSIQVAISLVKTYLMDRKLGKISNYGGRGKGWGNTRYGIILNQPLDERMLF